MLTGKQKAQLLLSMLGDKSKSVLSLLSPTYAALLTETIEEAPKASSSTLNALMNEIMQKVAHIRQTGALHSSTAATVSGGLGLGGGLGLFDGGDTLGVSDADSEADNTEHSGEKLRSPDQIAELLSEQRPQLVAFVLSRIDEALGEEIKGFLPLAMVEALSSLHVEPIPLSQQVFDNLYQDIFVLPPEELVSDSESLSEIPEKEEPNRVFFF